MKIILYFLILSSAFTCGNNEEENDVNIKDSAEAKTIEATAVEAEEDEEQSQLLVGPVKLEELRQPPYSAWFEAGYKSYIPSEEALAVIKKNINDYQIKGFFGTWCADSKREIPKFYKLLEQANFNMDQLEMYGVRRDKTIPGGTEKEYDIQYVPTFIFYKNGEEVGRFVEYPQERLEADIAKIVSGEEYQHVYQ